MSNNTISYRPDIDGLRAVAVLLVIAFHASPKKFPSGFIGVDIFFVISGYLISSIILKELNQNKFKIKDFYIKRVKRIFPSLLVVLFATLFLGCLALNSSEITQLFKHIAAGSFFVSNITLWLESGYFDQSSDYKPLLHLWSLSIEEQFYIFWPLLLSLFFTKKWNISFLIIGIIFGSFLFNIFSINGDPSGTFYFIHTRSWELLIGAGLAYLEYCNFKFSKPGIYQASSLVGLLCLGIAVFLIGKDSLFPGWWALLPTIGTFLLIFAGKDGLVNKYFLALKPVVAIGLISYPLYLWHWPLLSILRILEDGEPLRLHKNLAVGLSFILAWLTYLLIEKPVRLKLPKDKQNLFVLTATCVLFTFGLISFWQSQSLSSVFKRNDPSVKLSEFEVAPLRNSNCKKAYPTFTGEFCLLSKPTTPEILILGDSHAHALYEGIASAKPDKSVLLLGESACAPFINTVSFPERKKDRCLKEMNQAFEIIKASLNLKKIILHFRAATYVGTNLLSRPFEVAMKDTLQTLLNDQKSVTFIHQIPELKFNPKSCVRLHKINLVEKREHCNTPLSSVLDEQKAYRELVEQLDESILIYDPLQILCNKNECQAIIDSKILYRDDNHLNKTGAIYLIKALNL